VRAAVVHGPDQLEVQAVPEPAIGEYEALTQMLACGICTGTDAHVLTGRFPYLQPYPFILGHETVGRVLEVGRKVRSFKPGDLVLRPVAVRPGERLGAFGSVFGGLAEYGVVVDAQALVEEKPRGHSVQLPVFADAQQVLPPSFDPVDAGMLITLKEALSWMQRLGPLPGKSVLIFGTGPVGLCFTRIAKYLGARLVTTVGRRDVRLALAREMGADAVVDTRHQDVVGACRELTGGRGMDYVVEAVGDTDLLALGPRLVAPGGCVALYGAPPALTVTIDWAGMAGDWRLQFLNPHESETHELALDLIRLGFIDLRRFVSHVLPLEEVGEAFRLLREKQALKPVIVLHDDT
jgi:2-desacetyl-2-hydroxyethyl bacteriochlorophyllide A dehydrogenase